MILNSPVFIIEKGINQNINEECAKSEYKIKIIPKKIIVSNDFKKAVNKSWKLFKFANKNIAKDRLTYFFNNSINSSEDNVFREKFRYVQAIGKTNKFQNCPYEIYALSALCLIKTSDNKFVFGIKSNMNNKISGFSGYSCKKDTKDTEINVFNYLSRTIKEELNIFKKDIKSISRIGKTFSNKILDNQNYLNNRVYNNIFLINLNISEKKLIKYFNPNFQFKKILFLDDYELLTNISKNYNKFSAHCIGGVYCYFYLKNKQLFNKLINSPIKKIIKEKETILITGSSGFMGKYLADKFSERYKIVGIDSLKPIKIFKGKFYLGSITDNILLKKIFRENNIDYIIHTAANKHLIECENNRDESYKINFLATKEIYNFSKKYKSKFIYLSSDIVFDGKSKNYKENSQKHPINHYGTLKDLCEEFLIQDSKVAVCRTAMVFGLVEDNNKNIFKKMLKENSLFVQGYIIDHIKIRLSNKKRINLPKDEFCNPTNNYLFYRQIKTIIENNLSGIFHCCGSERISRYEFGKKIANFYNLDKTYIDNSQSKNPLRPKDVSLNSEKTQKIMKFKFDKIDEMIYNVLEEKYENIY